MDCLDGADPKLRIEIVGFYSFQAKHMKVKILQDMDPVIRAQHYRIHEIHGHAIFVKQHDQDALDGLGLLCTHPDLSGVSIGCPWAKKHGSGVRNPNACTYTHIYIYISHIYIFLYIYIYVCI